MPNKSISEFRFYHLLIFVTYLILKLFNVYLKLKCNWVPCISPSTFTCGYRKMLLGAYFSQWAQKEAPEDQGHWKEPPIVSSDYGAESGPRTGEQHQADRRLKSSLWPGEQGSRCLPGMGRKVEPAPAALH